MGPGSRKPKHSHQVQGNPHALYVRSSSVHQRPPESRDMAFHHISVIHWGWLGLETGLLEGMKDRQPQPAWASCKPSASTKAQHIHGPRDRLQRKTGNINTGCGLLWSSEETKSLSQLCVCRSTAHTMRAVNPPSYTGLGNQAVS